MRNIMYVCLFLLMSGVASAQNEVPISKTTLPNGVDITTYPSGEVWATIHPTDGAPTFRMEIFHDYPATGAFWKGKLNIDLPESDIVGAPTNATMGFYGNCSTKTYTILGIQNYAGGMPVGDTSPQENVAHRVISGTPMEHAFNVICAKP